MSASEDSDPDYVDKGSNDSSYDGVGRSQSPAPMDVDAPLTQEQHQHHQQEEDTRTQAQRERARSIFEGLANTIEQRLQDDDDDDFSESDDESGGGDGGNQDAASVMSFDSEPVLERIVAGNNSSSSIIVGDNKALNSDVGGGTDASESDASAELEAEYRDFAARHPDLFGGNGAQRPTAPEESDVVRAEGVLMPFTHDGWCCFYVFYERTLCEEPDDGGGEERPSKKARKSRTGKAVAGNAFMEKALRIDFVKLSEHQARNVLKSPMLFHDLTLLDYAPVSVDVLDNPALAQKRWVRTFPEPEGLGSQCHIRLRPDRREHHPIAAIYGSLYRKPERRGEALPLQPLYTVLQAKAARAYHCLAVNNVRERPGMVVDITRLRLLLKSSYGLEKEWVDKVTRAMSGKNVDALPLLSPVFSFPSRLKGNKATDKERRAFAHLLNSLVLHGAFESRCLYQVGILMGHERLCSLSPGRIAFLKAVQQSGIEDEPEAEEADMSLDDGDGAETGGAPPQEEEETAYEELVVRESFLLEAFLKYMVGAHALGLLAPDNLLLHWLEPKGIRDHGLCELYALGSHLRRVSSLRMPACEIERYLVGEPEWSEAVQRLGGAPDLGLVEGALARWYKALQFGGTMVRWDHREWRAFSAVLAVSPLLGRLLPPLVCVNFGGGQPLAAAGPSGSRCVVTDKRLLSTLGTVKRALTDLHEAGEDSPLKNVLPAHPVSRCLEPGSRLLFVDGRDHERIWRHLVATMHGAHKGLRPAIVAPYQGVAARYVARFGDAVPALILSLSGRWKEPVQHRETDGDGGVHRRMPALRECAKQYRKMLYRHGGGVGSEPTPPNVVFVLHAHLLSWQGWAMLLGMGLLQSTGATLVAVGDSGERTVFSGQGPLLSGSVFRACVESGRFCVQHVRDGPETVARNPCPQLPCETTVNDIVAGSHGRLEALSFPAWLDRSRRVDGLLEGGGPCMALSARSASSLAGHLAKKLELGRNDIIEGCYVQNASTGDLCRVVAIAQDDATANSLASVSVAASAPLRRFVVESTDLQVLTPEQRRHSRIRLTSKDFSEGPWAVVRVVSVGKVRTLQMEAATLFIEELEAGKTFAHARLYAALDSLARRVRRKLYIVVRKSHARTTLEISEPPQAYLGAVSLLSHMLHDSN